MMGKSIITIEEESLKDKKGRHILRRKIMVTSSRGKVVVHEDAISPEEIFSNNSEFNVFERWVVELYDKELNFILEEK